ncbi:MAG: hypothetical protein HZC15_03360 [Candidatus Omnitrophica bacterium]|nr:hypothetical protein [Candidatus Omnitrophota bacterium]
MLSSKQKDLKPKVSNAVKDLAMVVVVSVFVGILSYFFDVFVFIVRFLERHPQDIIYVDEIVTGLLALSIGLAFFAWRRWFELKKETAERIRLQEEIIRIANTKAETERIISKQLRSEIEIRKQDINPSFNHNKKKDL